MFNDNNVCPTIQSYKKSVFIVYKQRGTIYDVRRFTMSRVAKFIVFPRPKKTKKAQETKGRRAHVNQNTNTNKIVSEVWTKILIS